MLVIIHITPYFLIISGSNRHKLNTTTIMTINSNYVSIETDEHETKLCFWEDKEQTKLTYFKSYSNEETAYIAYKYWGSDLKTIECI